MKFIMIFCASVVFTTASCGTTSEGQQSKPAGNASATPVAVSTGTSPTPAASGSTLEGKYWTLTSATDAQSKAIDMPAASKDRPIVFTFADGIVSIQGPCNQMSGSYTGGNAEPLVIGPMRSTMKGCEPAVMTAESKLTAMLSGPLQVTLEGGGTPHLKIVNSSKETLSFDGKPTPDSLYGPAKIIFLEVAPKRIPCSNPIGETTCLQVRDRFFDENGLQSAPPGEWRPLYEKIEGYTHVEGQSNVIRVKSFMPPDSKANIYVLDLVVETQIAK